MGIYTGRETKVTCAVEILDTVGLGRSGWKKNKAKDKLQKAVKVCFQSAACC